MATSTLPLILSPSRNSEVKASTGRNNRVVEANHRLPACHETPYTETNSSTYGSHECINTEYGDGGISGTTTEQGKTERYKKSTMTEKMRTFTANLNQLPTIKSKQRISSGSKQKRFSEISRVPPIKSKTAVPVTAEDDKTDIEHAGRRRCKHCGSTEHRSRDHDLSIANDSDTARDAIESTVTETNRKYQPDRKLHDSKKICSTDYGNNLKRINKVKALDVNNSQRNEGKRSIELPCKITRQRTTENKPKNADVKRESRYRRTAFSLLNASSKEKLVNGEISRTNIDGNEPSKTTHKDNNKISIPTYMPRAETVQKHSFDTSLPRDKTSSAKSQRESNFRKCTLSSQILQGRTKNNNDQNSMKSNRVLVHQNPKPNSVKAAEKYINIRSHTTIDASPTNEKTSLSVKRSRSASKPQTSISNSDRHSSAVHAYNSVIRLEPRPKTKSDSVSKKLLASCPSLRSSNVSTRSASSNAREVWSIKDLSRYRETMVVYLDSKWQRNRRERFYRKLEEAQLQCWKEKRAATARQNRLISESRERQIKQLRYVRHKHQARRAKRLTSQHVKWKFVLDNGGSESKKFGLPSEYYTYYGFNPIKCQDESESESFLKKTVKSKMTKKQAPNDLNELRRRNQKRYDNIFSIGNNHPLNTINEIVNKGLFTIEVPTAENSSETASTKPNQLEPANTSTLKSKSLTKRSFRMLIVKDIVEEAKEIINSIDESYSDDFETDSVNR